MNLQEGLYIRMLPYFLLGYAVAGRSFAYLGAQPLYMGEILLLIGLWQLLHSFHLWKVFLQPVSWLLLFFMFWNLSRTLPYIPEYGVLALRDGALWGYGIFAFVIAMILIARPPLLLLLMQRYHSFVNIFPFLALGGLVVLTFYKRTFFDFTLLLQMKPGDIMVQLSAIIVFALCGLKSRVSFLWIAAVMGAVLIAGSLGRGGLLAFSLAIGFLLLLRLHHHSTWKLIMMLLVVFLTAASVMQLAAPVSAEETPSFPTREISPQQLIKNLLSVFMPAEQWGLEGTKRYRLQWWNKIIDYTFFGDYFIGGKGYGINLAISDDQLIRGDTSLRNPHNAHFTVLARSGVPGFFLWVALHLAWFFGVLRALIQSRLAGLAEWEGWFSTLLAFYLAALVNAGFDVYLSGPMGGIWFWTVFGTGMASLHLFRTLPELMMAFAHENIDHP